MVNVFKYTEDGYEMWSLPDRIKIYKYSEVFSRRSKNSQPEYISQFFEIIKYELKKSNLFCNVDVMSNYFNLDRFILGVEDDCISFFKSKKDPSKYINIRNEIKLDIFRKLDEF